MRQVVLDTETTGLEPSQGHRIIEIGCVELVNRRLTNQRYHQYINPQREVDEGALAVHGISNEFLHDKPVFEKVVGDFLDFIRGAELIIHNAPFDVGFLNHELAIIGRGEITIETLCKVSDSLTLARQLHPGQRNSLDALCKRYGIDNTHRELHGALLDAEILADVYLAMTGGQTSLSFQQNGQQERRNTEQVTQPHMIRRHVQGKLRVVRASEEECQAHESRLDALDKASKGNTVWRQLSETVES